MTITPIDWQGRMCGLTAEVPARWMTADGLAFVHARPVSLDRLLITMNDAPTGRFRLVASVLSTRTIGSTVEVIVRFEKKRSVPRPHFFSSFQRPTKDSQSTSSDTEKLKGH